MNFNGLENAYDSYDAARIQAVDCQPTDVRSFDNADGIGLRQWVANLDFDGFENAYDARKIGCRSVGCQPT